MFYKTGNTLACLCIITVFITCLFMDKKQFINEISEDTKGAQKKKLWLFIASTSLHHNVYHLSHHT